MSKSCVVSFAMCCCRLGLLLVGGGGLRVGNVIQHLILLISWSQSWLRSCFKVRCITSKQQHDNSKNHRGYGVERLQLAPAWGVSNDRRGNVNTTRLFVLMGWDGWDGMDGMGWAEWDGRNGMGWDGMGWDGFVITNFRIPPPCSWVSSRT